MAPRGAQTRNAVCPVEGDAQHRAAGAGAVLGRERGAGEEGPVRRGQEVMAESD